MPQLWESMDNAQNITYSTYVSLANLALKHHGINS